MKSLILKISIILFLFGCAGKKAQIKTIETAEKQTTDSSRSEQLRYTIIKDKKQANIILDSINLMWSPDQEQVNSIMSIARVAISKNENQYSRYLKADSLNSIYKQVICFIDKKGDSLVYINGMCEVGDYYEKDSSGNLNTHRFDWQNKILIVKDGGDCYWRLLINYSKKEYSDLSKNGEA
jgi:hypothetical protein